jgi:hypothetical protein
MSAWVTPAVRQQIHKDALRKLGRRATRPCPRCCSRRNRDRGLPPGRVPGLVFASRRCPRCRGEAEVASAAAERLERQMLRSWNRKQAVANARPKERL